MKAKTTVGSLIKELQKHDPKAAVRIKVTHDLDCEIVEQGVILGAERKKGLILLDCTDDGHGFPRK